MDSKGTVFLWQSPETASLAGAGQSPAMRSSASQRVNFKTVRWTVFNDKQSHKSLICRECYMQSWERLASEGVPLKVFADSQRGLRGVLLIIYAVKIMMKPTIRMTAPTAAKTGERLRVSSIS